MSRLCVFFCLTMFFLTGCTTQNYEKDINLKTMGPEIKNITAELIEQKVENDGTHYYIKVINKSQMRIT